MTNVILIVDGNNFILRNFFGMQRKNDLGETEVLKTSDGRESGALYGAISGFASLVSLIKPNHILWTFDSGRSKLRTEIRPEYKANRDKEPSFFGDSVDGNSVGSSDRLDFKATFDHFKEFLSITGIKFIEERGVEADDIICSAAHEFSKDISVVIISQDHDLLQLVGEKVLVYKSSSSRGKQDVIFDVQEVVNKYGTTPQNLPKLWSLTGDVGDNIRGVRGLGEVKALRALVASSMNLQEVVNINPFVLADQAAERVLENYRLIKLDPNVATFDLKLSDCAFDPESGKLELRQFLKDWEMNSLVSKLDVGMFW